MIGSIKVDDVRCLASGAQPPASGGQAAPPSDAFVFLWAEKGADAGKGGGGVGGRSIFASKAPRCSREGEDCRFLARVPPYKGLLIYWHLAPPLEWYAPPIAVVDQTVTC